MASGVLRLGVGQIDPVLRDVDANLTRIEQTAEQAHDQGCQLVVFPELALSGYAVGAGYERAALCPGCPEVTRLETLSRKIGVVVGFIEETEDAKFYNSAMFIQGGAVRHVHRKVYLPNYRVFDERRYFGAGRGVWAFDTPWCRMALLICGDAWHMTLPYLSAHDGADVLVVVAASSSQGLTEHIDVRQVWERMNRSAALTLNMFVVFANRVGQEDLPHDSVRLRFWGGSHVCLPDGSMAPQAPFDEEHLLLADLDLTGLRKQRIILPFRRDDSLELTVEMGKRILRRKFRKRDGFLGLIGARKTDDEDNGGQERVDLPSVIEPQS